MVQNKYAKQAWIYCGVVLLAFILFIPVLTREVNTAKSVEPNKIVDSVEPAKPDKPTEADEPTELVEPEKSVKKDNMAEQTALTGTGVLTEPVEDSQAVDASGNLAASTSNVYIEEIIWPVEGEIIREVGLSYAQTFSDYRYHNGIDIKVERGAQALMTLSGRVMKKETTKDNGLVITVEHGQQDGAVWCSIYAHLSETALKEGDYVEAGEPVGIIDQPGYNEIVEGPHLHYSLYQDEQVVNPLDYLP